MTAEQAMRTKAAELAVQSGLATGNSSRFLALCREIYEFIRNDDLPAQAGEYVASRQGPGKG